jgi:hypothetical protein
MVLMGPWSHRSPGSACSKSPTGSPPPPRPRLLADLGADVIKVEPPGGEIYREFLLRSMGYTHEFTANYGFQTDNRGKRSVTVALDAPGGPELVRRLAARSDVFVTNLIQQRRVRYRPHLGGRARGEPAASCTRRSRATARAGPTRTARASTTRRSGRARA